jgi:hypothetical protein
MEKIETNVELTATDQNIITLERELKWFEKIVQARMAEYFTQELSEVDIYKIFPPDLQDDNSIYANVVKHYDMNMYERLMLILALIPHIKPQLLDQFFIKNNALDKAYTELGGIKGIQHTGFLPTGETAMFIMAGGSLMLRLNLHYLFDKDHFFSRDTILEMDASTNNEPALSKPLLISKEYLNHLTKGETYRPAFSTSFPASLLNTQLNWDDLVIDDDVITSVKEINIWLKHGNELLNRGRIGHKIKRGYRALFHGPPGTGKTLTASLLGKSNDLDVYRIDLSMVVSKYIGETEKNLASVFDQAENKNWLLFFDEADALFGKRTATKDSKDRFANQEVSYLLQRIEDFPGLIILASNFKSNIDDAFARRFQSVIHFPIPNAELRYSLWQKAFEGEFELDPKIQLKEIASKYELSGGAITNVLRYCGLMSIHRGDNIILHEDLINGIKKEIVKEGKIMG